MVEWHICALSLQDFFVTSFIKNLNFTIMKRSKIKKVTREKLIKVIEQDLTCQFGIDSTAQFIMDGLEDRVSPELQEILNDMLLGFNDDMQLEIADNLLDFTCGHVIHTTGCSSADVILAACYTWIAAEKGIDLSIIK